MESLNWQTYLQIAKDNLQFQDEIHRQFTTRAINLVGFGVTMVAAGAIALGLQSDTPADLRLYISFGAWALGFLVVLVSCIYVLWARNWRHGPSVRDFRKYVEERNPVDTELLRTVGDGYYEASYYNNYELNRKRRATIVALLFLLVEAAGLISLVSSVLFGLSGSPPPPSVH